MILEQLMNNVYVWSILAVCTIFSVFYAIYTRVTSKEKKEISYMVNTYEIVRSGENMIPEFQISYSGQPICNLTVSRFAIWNSGNRLLDFNDIVDTKPLSIISDDGADILNASIIKYSEEANKFTVEKISAHCAELKFDYMDKHDGIVLQILHTGSIKNISLSVLIKGGKKLKNAEKHVMVIKNKKMYKAIYIALLSFEMVILLITSITLIVETLDQMQHDVPLEFMLLGLKVSPLILLATIAVISVIATIMYYQIVKKKFHLNVPSTLRDSIEYNR